MSGTDTAEPWGLVYARYHAKYTETFESAYDALRFAYVQNDRGEIFPLALTYAGESLVANADSFDSPLSDVCYAMFQEDDDV